MVEIKEYSSGETKVVQGAEECIHSAICAKGLTGVFRPSLKPQIEIDTAKKQVK